MLGEAPVSSMKMRRSIARMGCRSRHAGLARATSALSCSAACTVFFEAKPFALEEAPQHRSIGLDTALGTEPRGDRPQGQVIFMGHQLKKPITLRLQDRS